MSHPELGDWLHDYNSFHMSLEYLSVNNQYMYIVYTINYRSYFVLYFFPFIIIINNLRFVH